MGYYIQLVKSTAFIPEQNKDKVFQLWKDLNKPENNHLKRGGSWGGGGSGKTAHWFSWMSEDYDKTATGCEDILKMLGFNIKIKKNNIYLTFYDSKTGQEDLFLETAQEYFADNTYLLFKGEDNTYYAHIFFNKKMLTLEAENKKLLLEKINEILLPTIEQKHLNKVIQSNIDNKGLNKI